MRTIHQTLQLQPHHHTGKLLHHRHTSYRSLAAIIAIAGVFMLCLSAVSHAAAQDWTVTVTARNPAPIPSEPAVITQPTDGTVVTNPTLTIIGTCPAISPRVSIGIIDSGTLVSSTSCSVFNTFSVTITLDPGEHTLIARTFTITGDSGPDSIPVHVTYTSPAPKTTTTTKSSGASGTTSGSTQGSGGTSIAPLNIVIDEPFIIFGPHEPVTWKGTISGGTGPYTLDILWGDGSTNTYIEVSPGAKQYVHQYTSMTSHIITIRLYDTSGQRLIRQYVAVTPYITPITGNLLGGTAQLPFLQTYEPYIVYGTYALLVSVFGILWILSDGPMYAPVKVVHTTHRRAATRRRTSTRKRR